MSDGEKLIQVIELFAEEAQLPSATRERRVWRRVLRDRDRYAARRESLRLNYFADKFLRVQSKPPEPLTKDFWCWHCGARFASEIGERNHVLQWCKVASVARSEAAE